MRGPGRSVRPRHRRSANQRPGWGGRGPMRGRGWAGLASAEPVPASGRAHRAQLSQAAPGKHHDIPSDITRPYVR